LASVTSGPFSGELLPYLYFGQIAKYVQREKIHMTEEFEIDLATVNEYINQALDDQSLSSADRQVALWLQEFIQKGGGVAKESSKETAIRFEPLAPGFSKIAPLIDFQYSFRGNSTNDIIEIRTRPLQPPQALLSVAALWTDRRGEKGLVYHILRELYEALCKDVTRYRDEVAVLSTNAKLLVGAITGYVAGQLGGSSVLVLGAATATILWLILKIGVNSFCNFYASVFEPA
jgi:hypothetical protein